MRTVLPSALCLFALAGCNAHRNTAGNSTAPTGTVLSSLGGSGAGSASSSAPTLADGPDVCFKAIAKHLGANTKVSEVTSFFSGGSDLEDMERQPKGTLTTCTVNYQNPADPRKLLGTSMNVSTGDFDAPRPVEITVMGGDEAAFKLDDYIIPLSQVNAAALIGVMKAQEPKLGSYYGKWAWTGVRLSAPDAFSRTHTLRLDVAGRLKANDIKKDGYASVTPDGQKITTNFLTS